MGPEYDHVLRLVAADIQAEDVYKERRLLKAIRTDAMATTEPLQSLIAKYVDEEVMEKIAEGHREGRGLSIGTANLDSMRPVIWRLGAIANSGHPDALKLIRKILLASASIPGAPNVSKASSSESADAEKPVYEPPRLQKFERLR